MKFIQLTLKNGGKIAVKKKDVFEVDGNENGQTIYFKHLETETFANVIEDFETIMNMLEAE